MDEKIALAAFTALGQPTRLAVFRLLVSAGPEGLAAGEIASRLDVRPNTLSPNLAQLEAAGLIAGQREGRSIRYTAQMAGIRALLEFLMEDCCGGRPEMCRPLLDAVAAVR